MSATPLTKEANILNSLPDCVFITPLFSACKKGKMTISFTMLFGEHKEADTFIGEIRFGIKNGELVLDIENGEVDPLDIEFIKEFSAQTTISAIDENQDSQSKTRRQSQDIKGNLSLTASIDSNLGVYNEVAASTGNKKTISFTKIISHIKANWHPTKPRWNFGNQIWDAYLEGRIDKLKFATIGAKTFPLIIKYRFEIKPKDIYFTDVPLVKSAVTANKRAVLHTFITKIILKLQDTLSEGSYTYYE